MRTSDLGECVRLRVATEGRYCAKVELMGRPIGRPPKKLQFVPGAFQHERRARWRTRFLELGRQHGTLAFRDLELVRGGELSLSDWGRRYNITSESWLGEWARGEVTRANLVDESKANTVAGHIDEFAALLGAPTAGEEPVFRFELAEVFSCPEADFRRDLHRRLDEKLDDFFKPREIPCVATFSTPDGIEFKHGIERTEGYRIPVREEDEDVKKKLIAASLYVLSGFTREQIADQLNSTPQTVYNWLHDVMPVLELPLRPRGHRRP
jgi:hypothetical protein